MRDTSRSVLMISQFVQSTNPTDLTQNQGFICGWHVVGPRPRLDSLQLPLVGQLLTTISPRISDTSVDVEGNGSMETIFTEGVPGIVAAKGLRVIDVTPTLVLSACEKASSPTSLL